MRRRVRAAAAVAATTRPTSPMPVSTVGAFAWRRAAGPAGAASGRESRVVVAPPTMRMSVFRLPPPLLLLVLVARRRSNNGRGVTTAMAVRAVERACSDKAVMTE